MLQIVDKKGKPKFLITDEEGEIIEIDELIFPVDQLKKEDKQEEEDATE